MVKSQRKRERVQRTVEEAEDVVDEAVDTEAAEARPWLRRAAVGIALVLVVVGVVVTASGHQTQLPPSPPRASLSQAERDDFVHRYAVHVPEQLENERPDERTQFWDFRTSPPTPPPPSLPPRPPPVLFSEIDCADVCERVHALMQCTSDCCDEACRRDKRPGHGCEPDHCDVLKRRDAYFALKGG